MDKRAMSMTVLVTLIVLLAGAIVMGFATNSISNLIKSSSDSETCRQSVLLKSQTFTSALNIPLKCKSQDQTLKNEDELKNAKEIIAKGMYNCWNQFGEGKLDFVEPSFFNNNKIWCFICNKIGFDSSLNNKIIGLDQYLSDEQVPLIGKTYSEFLFGNTNPDLSVFKEFPTDNPLYIVYTIDKTSYSWKQVAGSVAIGCGAGALALGVTVIGAPLGCIGAGVTAGVANVIYQVSSTNVQLKHYLLVSNSQDVITKCQGSKYANAGEYCKNECGKGIANLCDEKECNNLKDYDCFYDLFPSIPTGYPGGLSTSNCYSCPTDCGVLRNKDLCDQCKNCKFENNKCLFKGFSGGQFGGTGAGKSW